MPNKWLGNRWLVRWHPAVRAMHGVHYNVAINASNSFSSQAALLVHYVGARQAAGVAAHGGSLYDRLYDHADQLAVHDGLEVHQVLQVAGVVRRAGLRLGTLVELGATLPFDRRGVQATALINICPDVNRPESAWPLDHWRTLIEALREQFSQYALHLVLVTSQSPYRGLASLPGVRYAETPGFDNFAGALARAALVICSEGGTSHVAPALGTPVIVLSGKAIARTWMPWTRRAVVLEAPDQVQASRPLKSWSKLLRGCRMESGVKRDTQISGIHRVKRESPA